MSQRVLLERAHEALDLRWQIRRKNRMECVRWIYIALAFFFRSFRPRRHELLFAKASNRLEKELDIKQLIRHMRFTRNMLTFLTTRRERNLVRMQAAHNVMDLRMIDGKTGKFVTAEGQENSSDFDSGQQRQFVREMLAKQRDFNLVLTHRELKLL